jgi:hypothetical protein
MVFSKVGAELNDGVGDSRDAAEGSFDFGGFETDAVELDLVIDTTEEVELSVVVEAYQVAGSVEALTGAGGVREEALGGKGRPVEVAAGNALATDIEFAGCACWDGIEEFVEHLDMDLTEGGSQRWDAGGVDEAGGRADRGFSGSIGVD